MWSPLLRWPSCRNRKVKENLTKLTTPFHKILHMMALLNNTNKKKRKRTCSSGLFCSTWLLIFKQYFYNASISLSDPASAPISAHSREATMGMHTNFRWPSITLNKSTPENNQRKSLHGRNLRAPALCSLYHRGPGLSFGQFWNIRYFFVSCVLICISFNMWVG